MLGVKQVGFSGNPTNGEYLKDLEDAYDQGEHVDELAHFVMAAASKAKNFRTSLGIDRRFQKALNAVNCVYDPEDCRLLDHNAIYMPVINTKVRGFRAWIGDILINSEDRPWTIAPTPIPDLPEEVEDVVIDAFMDEVSRFGFTGSIETRLSQLKHIAKGHMDKVTADSASRMETVIEDQMIEGEWREEFDKFIDDLATYPAAVLKGPVVTKTMTRRWNGSKVEMVHKPVYKVCRVDPRNLYPSPDSTTAQKGAYLVELTNMCASELLDAGDLPAFKKEAVAAMLDEYPVGWSWGFAAEQATLAADSIANGEDGGASTTPMVDTGGVYDVLVYYGRMAGRYLAENGVEGLDERRTYEAEVWVCGGYVISAKLNPHETGRRPFYVTSFDKVAGQFWGRGLPDILHDIQRVANATIRALVKNMAFSAGPIGEVDVSRMANETDIDEVEPYRLFRVENDPLMPSQSRALHFHNIPTNTQELNYTYAQFLKHADDVSGIPAYVLGNPQASGAGRTLGGLSLLMGNAAKGIKRIIGHIDKDLIEPLVEQYAYLNLMYNEELDIKFDLTVVARGSSGLMQRELSQSRAVELLQVLTPFVQPGPDGEMIVPVKGLQVVIRDVIRNLGYRADDIAPDPGRGGDLEQFLGAAGAGGEQGGVSSTLPGTSQPALDGRSAVPLPV